MRNFALASRLAFVAALAVCSAARPAGAQHLVEANPGDPAEVLSETQGLLAEPIPVTRAILTLDRVLGGGGGLSEGFYTVFGDMPSGAGWISLGEGYRRFFSHEQVFVDTSGALSWRGYRTAQAQIALPKLLHQRLVVGSQFRWTDATQVNFYGEGPDSLASNRSQFRMRTNSFGGYAAVRPARWMAIEGRIGVMQPTLDDPGGLFKQNFPPTSAVDPGNIVYSLPEQPSFLHQEMSVVTDTRDFPGHPTSGGILRASAARYADRDADLFTFTRYEAEAARFVSLPRVPIVLALHGWLVASDPGEGQTVPFYLQPSLGGQNTLRSYADYRFHDRSALVMNVEARVPVMTHLDGAVFLDAGNVAARVGDLNLDQKSYGVGLRLHSRQDTFARLDLAHGGEGWRVMFRLNDPLYLTRLSRRLASAPFVP